MNELMEKIAKSKSRLGVPVLMALVLGFSVSGAVVAQTCTLDNWNGGSVETGETLLAASRAAGNRAYAGPCSLKVTLDSSDAYLVDDTPLAETQFNVRFYFFLDSVDADVTLFEALDANDSDVINVTYDHSDGLVSTLLYVAGGGSETVSVGPVAPGWNSVEIEWGASATEEVKMTLGNSSAAQPTETSPSIDTSGFTIDSVRLGAMSGLSAVPSTGVIYFDDYDSRRDTVPGRLCRGLTDSTRSSLNLEDVQAIFTDFATAGGVPASGVPDYDQNGSVDLQDVIEVFTRFATGQDSCTVNS